MPSTTLYAKNCLQTQDGAYIQFATRASLLSLKREQIRYIEGSRNYQLLHLTDRSAPLEVKMTMEKLEALTQPHGFIRIHKGYLVNYRYIQRIHATQVTLDDGVVLPIGRSKMGEVKSHYLALLGGPVPVRRGRPDAGDGFSGRGDPPPSGG